MYPVSCYQFQDLLGDGSWTLAWTAKKSVHVKVQKTLFLVRACWARNDSRPRGSMLFKQKGSYMGTTASLMLTISYYIDDLPTSLVCPSFPNWGPTLLHCAIDRLLVYSPPPHVTCTRTYSAMDSRFDISERKSSVHSAEVSPSDSREWGPANAVSDGMESAWRGIPVSQTETMCWRP